MLESWSRREGIGVCGCHEHSRSIVMRLSSEGGLVMFGQSGYSPPRSPPISVKSNGACGRWKSVGTYWCPHFRECRGDRRPRRGDRCRGVEQHSRPVSRGRQFLGRRSGENRQRGGEAWQRCLAPPFQGSRASPARHARSCSRRGNSCGHTSQTPSLTALLVVKESPR
jgi:hypothetical protein